MASAPCHSRTRALLPCWEPHWEIGWSCRVPFPAEHGVGTHHGEAALLLLGDGALAQEAGDYDKSTRPDEDAGGGSEGAGGQDAEVATSLHQGPDAHGQDSCPPRPAGDHQVGAGGWRGPQELPFLECPLGTRHFSCIVLFNSGLLRACENSVVA